MVLAQDTHYGIHFYSLLAFAFLLPIYPYAAVLALNITALNWLLSGEWKDKWKRMKHPFVITSVLFFLWHVAGMMWTEQQQVGGMNLETKLSFLVMPLVIYTSGGLSEQCRKKVLLGFVSGVISSVLIALSLSGYNAINEGYQALFYTKMSETIGQHPTYMGLYVSFSFFCLLYFFVLNRARFKRFEQLAFTSVLLVLYLVIFLLSSRIIILAFTLMLGTASFIYYWRQRKIIYSFLLVFVVIGTNAIITFGIPNTTTSQRMSRTLTQKHSENIRVFIWKEAISLTRHQPIIGVGSGDLQQHLNKHYSQKDAHHALKLTLDVHNQYLQTSASLGLIGLILLLGMLCITFFYAVQNNHIIALFMVVLVAIVLLTESAFERQWGILFYCFFASLFMMDYIPNQDQTKDECKIIPINRKARPF